MTTELKSHAKVGVYVDAANISRNGGQRMQYDVLREFACRDHAEPLSTAAQRINFTETLTSLKTST